METPPLPQRKLVEMERQKEEVAPTECFCATGGPVRKSCATCPAQRRRGGPMIPPKPSADDL